MKNKIKKLQVQKWLLSGRTITARQCTRMYGADRLADIIYQLKEQGGGMNIQTIIVHGTDRNLDPVHYAKYKWLGETPRIVFKSINKHKFIIYDFYHKYPMAVPKIKRHIADFLKKNNAVASLMRYSKKNSEVFVTAGKNTFFFHISNK